jgi:hypothetical protein
MAAALTPTFIGELPDFPSDIDPEEHEGFSPGMEDEETTYWPLIEYVSDQHGWYGNYPIFHGYDQC